jgi:hypothetical protein
LKQFVLLLNLIVQLQILLNFRVSLLDKDHCPCASSYQDHANKDYNDDSGKCHALSGLFNAKVALDPAIETDKSLFEVEQSVVILEEDIAEHNAIID